MSDYAKAEMEAFDALPFVLREFCRNNPIDSIDAYFSMQRHNDVNKVINELKKQLYFDYKI